jgi:hypothetical protein
MQTNNLIKLYFHVCNKYKEQMRWEVQRFSNNTPQQGIITDEELITIYLFCLIHAEQYKIKSMYRYIKNHWHSWFPLLPSYQAFNARLNHLWEAFSILMMDCMNSRAMLPANDCKLLLGDSFPVITCSHKRAAKVARELTDKGYCATKKLHYYGVKVHALALSRPSTIPFPQYLNITSASVHDLSASRAVLESIPADATVLDKAYADKSLAKQMQQTGNLLLTPIKDKKGSETVLRQTDRAFNDLFNSAVSSIRQPVASLFNWINQRTQIQNASKVRSSNGLLLHLYGKLAAALLIMTNF